MKTITFGVNSAPYLALRTLLELSQECKQIHPLASSILNEEIYVDDVLAGGYDLEDAQEKQIQLSQALISVCFPLKKITSNHLALLENLAREDLFLYTDSSIVLGWLQKPPYTLKTFVANRVSQITRLDH